MWGWHKPTGESLWRSPCGISDANFKPRTTDTSVRLRHDKFIIEAVRARERERGGGRWEGWREGGRREGEKDRTIWETSGRCRSCQRDKKASPFAPTIVLDITHSLGATTPYGVTFQCREDLVHARYPTRTRGTFLGDHSGQWSERRSDEL